MRMKSKNPASEIKSDKYIRVYNIVTSQANYAKNKKKKDKVMHMSDMMRAYLPADATRQILHGEAVLSPGRRAISEKCGIGVYYPQRQGVFVYGFLFLAVRKLVRLGDA